MTYSVPAEGVVVDRGHMDDDTAIPAVKGSAGEDERSIVLTVKGRAGGASPSQI